MLDLPRLDGGDSYIPGRVADWRIELRGGSAAATRAMLSADPISAADGGKFVLNRSDYLGSIDCQLASGLEGNRVSVKLDRISDNDHRRIARAYAICLEERTQLVLDLFLGWADGGKAYLGMALGGDLTNVGRFAVKRIDAHIDGIKRSLQLSGSDLLLHRLEEKRISTDATFATHTEAAQQILRLAGIGAPEPNGTDGAIPASPPANAPILSDQEGDEQEGDEQEVTIPSPGKALTLLRNFASEMETEYGMWGRKPFLVRDGGIAVGTMRAVPFGHQHTASVAGGLISAQLTGTEPKDKGYDPELADDQGPPMRKRFEIRHLGAPELKVGDTIMVPLSQADSNSLPPAVDAMLPGSLNQEEHEIYISSVHHVIGPNSGFLTTFTGVVVDTSRLANDVSSVWNIRSNLSDEDQSHSEDEIDSSSPAGRLAQSVLRTVERRLGSVHHAVVGEVRYHQSESTDDPSKPQFTSAMLHGTIPNRLDPEGTGATQRSHLVRNGRIHRSANNALTQIPYVTPFAWGRFGLVLPRYPGMRQFSVPRHASATDYVDIGSVWHTENGADSAGPMQAQTGDWWLSLPVGASDGSALTNAESGAMPNPDATACTDITNSDGERLLSFSKFTIKTGLSALHEPGMRPDPKQEDENEEKFWNGIIIEQSDNGARIAINDDGEISILGNGGTDAPAASITIDKDGDITINAQNVNFNVSGAVNVNKV